MHAQRCLDSELLVLQLLAHCYLEVIVHKVHIVQIQHASQRRVLVEMQLAHDFLERVRARTTSTRACERAQDYLSVLFITENQSGTPDAQAMNAVAAQ